MKRLLIYEPSFRRVESRVAEVLGDVELLLMDERGEISLNGAPVSVDDAQPQAGWASADVFEAFGGVAGRNYMVAMLKSAQLQWVQSAAAGFDHPVFGQLVQKGVQLSTSHGQAVGMAETVIAGVLDHFQRAPERRAAQARSAWERYPFREIMGTTWLIVGFGAIGRGVAQRARGFGAKIIGVRRDQTAHPLADELTTLDAFRSRLPQADVVVLSVPLSPATRHVVDAPFLAAMKPASVLVNVGRGGLVDEPALLTALEAGKPEHAVLDVFETEPLPSDSPFYLHPRVTMIPHASGISDGVNARNDELFADNMRRFVRGEPLLNVASKADVLGA